MNHEQSQQAAYAQLRFARQPQGFLGKLIAGLLSAAFLVLAFMFSLAALAVVAVGGVIFAGWLWWKTRQLRKALREQGSAYAFAGHTQGAADERIIEGEVIRTKATEQGNEQAVRLLSHH